MSLSLQSSSHLGGVKAEGGGGGGGGIPLRDVQELVIYESWLGSVHVQCKLFPDPGKEGDVYRGTFVSILPGQTFSCNLGSACIFKCVDMVFGQGHNPLQGHPMVTR